MKLQLETLVVSTESTDNRRKYMIKKLNWFQILGISILLSYALHDVLGILIYKTYQPLINEVSMLTSVGAPSRIVSTIFSTLYGVLSIVLVGKLIHKVKDIKSKHLNISLYVFLSMHIVSSLGYLFFPLTYGENQLIDNIHVYGVTTYVVIASLISTIGLFSYGIKFKIKPLIILSITTIIFMMTGAIGTNLFVQFFGIFERMSSYSVVIFTSLLGIYYNQLLQLK